MLNDRICGSGQMIYFNGDEYCGEWVNEMVTLYIFCFISLFTSTNTYLKEAPYSFLKTHVSDPKSCTLIFC